MISYEKVRRSLRNLTLAIAWLNVIAAGYKIFALFGTYLISQNLDQYASNAAAYENLKQSISLANVLLLILALICNILIAVFAFLNLSKIADDKPNYLPYVIGLVYTVLYNLIGFILSGIPNIAIFLTSLIIPIIFLVIYAFGTSKTKTLLEKDDLGEDL